MRSPGRNSGTAAAACSDDTNAATVGEILDSLGGSANAWLDEEGESATGRQLRFEADVRYRGQGSDFTLDIDPVNLPNWGLRDLADRFATAFEQRHGVRLDAPVELVRLRAVAGGRAAGRRNGASPGRSAPRPSGRGDASGAKVGEQRIYLDGNFLTAPVYATNRPGGRQPGRRSGAGRRGRLDGGGSSWLCRRGRGRRRARHRAGPGQGQRRMTPPRSSTPSLDAMLESTREQFDRTFADRLRQADAAGLRNRGQRAAAPEEPAAEPHAEAASDIDAVLSRRFGADWSAELVETQVTGNTLSALYRLTVDGRSALEFGDAPADQDREAALESARRSALARAADALAHGAQPSAATTDPAPPRAPAAPATTGQRAAPAPSGALDALALDRIEAAWRQIRKEAGNVLAQAAIAEPVRQKAAETATLTDARGATLIGRPVPAVADLARNRSRDLRPGDVFLVGDPYAGVQAGTWTAIVPVFAAETGGDPVGFSAATAPMAGSAGAAPGSAPNGARSVYGEGLRIPPIRIFDNGQAGSAALDLMLNNIPESGAAHGDLRALVEAAQAGERGIADLCVPLRDRELPAGLRRGAGAHRAGPAPDRCRASPRRAEILRGQDRQRRLRQRTVHTQAGGMARGRTGVFRLDGHGSPGRRAGQPAA